MNYSEFFQAYPLVLPIAALVLGLLLGSFLNVVIYRLPVMMENEWTAQCKDLLKIEQQEQQTALFNLAVPASHCPKCKTPIKAGENIPVISYLLQKGRCRHCQTRISSRYPLIEISTGLLFFLAVLEFGFSWLSLAVLVLTCSLIVMTMIDFDHQLLPDDLTLPMLWLGLLVNSFSLITPLQSAVFGAIAGYGILWLVYWAFKLSTGKEGMGYGDFKLLAALGAWMGWQALPMIILLSSLVAAIVGISMIIFRGRDRNIPIPFGPYLASAGFISLLWGDRITALYYSYMM